MSADPGARQHVLHDIADLSPRAGGQVGRDVDMPAEPQIAAFRQPREAADSHEMMRPLEVAS